MLEEYDEGVEEGVVVEGGAGEDRPGEGVGMAVDPDAPAFGGRRGRKVALKAGLRVSRPPFRGRPGWFWFWFFCVGFGFLFHTISLVSR